MLKYAKLLITLGLIIVVTENFLHITKGIYNCICRSTKA